MVPRLRARAAERRQRGVAGRLGSPVATVASLLVALLAATAVAGCGGSSRPRSTAATEAARKRMLNLSVVAIEARVGADRVRSSGTVIAASRGLVLTSAHSVWGATSLRVTTGVGVLHGRVVARAPCHDLALLETQPRVPGLVSLAAAAGGLSSSAPLIAMGRRATSADVGSASLLSIPVRASGGAARMLPGLRIRALDGAARLDSDLVSEATGGPLLDRHDRAVGMAIVAGRHASTAVVLPWTAIRTRLERLRPGPRRTYVGWRSQYRCVDRLHAFARAAHPGFDPRDAQLYRPPPVSRLPGTEDLD